MVGGTEESSPLNSPSSRVKIGAARLLRLRLLSGGGRMDDGYLDST